MIELDYAFLADYAAVQNGKLTVVGASFTDLLVSELPSETMLSVAGRVRCAVEVPSVGIKIEVSPPNDDYRITAELELGDLHLQADYGEKRGVLFAVQLSLSLPTTGLYEVSIDVDGTTSEVDRVLKFAVQHPER